MIENGDIKKIDTCYVWKKGMSEWELISSNKHFEEIVKSEMPPPLPFG